jgi:hypothetical protein
MSYDVNTASVKWVAEGVSALLRIIKNPRLNKIAVESCLFSQSHKNSADCPDYKRVRYVRQVYYDPAVVITRMDIPVFEDYFTLGISSIWTGEDI